MVDDTCMMIVCQGVLAHQIIVGEIGPHPRTHHHRRRNLEHLVDLGEIIPHLRIEFEGLDSLVLTGGKQFDQGPFHSHVPDLHPHRPFPVFGDHLHLHLRVT